MSYSSICAKCGKEFNMRDETKMQANNDAASIGWLGIESAPQDGRMILVCLPRIMNLVVRARFNTVHKFWQTDYEGEGGIVKPHFFHAGDLWHEIPKLPNDKAQLRTK